MHFAECLETFFDSHDDLRIFDILQLHGNLARDEKAQIINLFINGCEERSYLILNILCATSGVGNAGIDSKKIRSVIRLSFPPSIMDTSQEKGRTGCNPTASLDKYSYNLFFSLGFFYSFLKR